jgi:beta-glucanase (GH16 family)
VTRRSLGLLLVVAGCGPPGGGAPMPLLFADEFDGPAGARPDPSRWTVAVGGDGWGNQELQFYTDRPENVALDGAGRLVITARRELFQGRDYTSGRLDTRGRFMHAYGRFEARLRVPAGKGLWPAFWLLGDDVGSAGWPACGEIDVIESRGAQPARISASAHGPGYAGGEALIGGYQRTDGASLADAFHTYAVDWTPDELRFSVDGAVFHTVKATRLPAGGRWVFDHPFFLLLDLAVGGTFGGPPDDSTQLPRVLLIDYVRVYAAAPGDGA